MAFIFPTRTTSSSAQDHLADHNLLASLLDRAGGYTPSSTRAQHLAEHNAIHPTFALATRALGDSAAVHLSDHSTMRDVIIATYAGPRGSYGQLPAASISNYPVSFDVDNIADFGTLQTAVNNAGTGRKFHITGSFAFTAVIQPHASDEFWGADNVTITRSGAISSAFKPATTSANVKIMNLAFDGFNAATGTGTGGSTDNCLHANGSSGWEVAYCYFTNLYYAVNFGAGTGSVAHHNEFTGTGGTFQAFHGRSHVFRDNKFGPSIGDSTSTGGQKFLGTRGTQFIHNHCDGNARGGVWFDTSNSESLVEFNIIENTGSASPMGGVAYEICYFIDGTETGNNLAVQIDNTTKNVVRYNLFRNNLSGAVQILSSSWVEVYGNTFSQDTTNVNVGTIHLRFNDPTPQLGGFTFDNLDLVNNYIHNNRIVQTTASRYAVTLSIVGVDGTPYYDNSKNNDFEFNDFDLIDPSTTTAFNWNGAKTFAQWQAIPQDASGTAV